MWIFVTICGLLVMFSPVSLARAQQQPLPSFSIAEVCEAKDRDLRELLSRGNGPLPEPDRIKRPLLQSGCESQERAALVQLKAVWSTLPQAAIMDMCFRHKLPSGMLLCISGWRRDEEKKAERLRTIAQLTAAGEPIPKYDVESTCRVAAARERDPRSDYLDCVAKQQRAYDALKPIWPKLSKELISKCQRIMVGYPRYSVLQSCVDYSLDDIVKVNKMPKGQFRY